MWKLMVGIIAVLCTVFVAPFSAAQNSQFFSSASDHRSDLQTRIDLLESGINPGFTSDPEIDNAQFMESVARFQAANGLRITGSLDEQTLATLNIPFSKFDAAAIERAKPSK